MESLLFALACTFYLSMSATSVLFFRASNVGARRGKRLISVVGGAAVAVVLWMLWHYPAMSSMALPVSFAFYVVALSLFWWAYAVNRLKPLDFAFSSEPPQALVQSGPYRWVRHPFYASYVLGWLSAAIAAPGLTTGGVATVMTLIYLKAAVAEEAAFEKSEFAELHRSYRLKAGLMWPQLWRGS